MYGSYVLGCTVATQWNCINCCYWLQQITKSRDKLQKRFKVLRLNWISTDYCRITRWVTCMYLWILHFSPQNMWVIEKHIKLICPNKRREYLSLFVLEPWSPCSKQSVKTRNGVVGSRIEQKLKWIPCHHSSRVEQKTCSGRTLELTIRANIRLPILNFTIGWCDTAKTLTPSSALNFHSALLCSLPRSGQGRLHWTIQPWSVLKQ